MDFIVSGQIVQILPLQQGVSQRTGNQWQRASYIIEHEPGQYPKRMVFDVKDAKIQELNLQVGEYVTVHLNVDCREYNGRFFNSIEAWRAERPGQVQQPTQGYQQAQTNGVIQQQAPFPQQGQQMPQQNPFPPHQQMPQQGQQTQLPFPPAQ